MNRLTSRNAFSLIEVLVASVIFLIAVIGILSIFVMGKRSSEVSESQIIAANLGRQALEGLRAKVDQRVAWPLTCDGSERPWPWPTFINKGLNTPAATYVCTTLATGAKKVELKITWVDPQ